MPLAMRIRCLQQQVDALPAQHRHGRVEPASLKSLESEAADMLALTRGTPLAADAQCMLGVVRTLSLLYQHRHQAC